jgi:hypothetical protein
VHATYLAQFFGSGSLLSAVIHALGLRLNTLFLRSRPGRENRWPLGYFLVTRPLRP